MKKIEEIALDYAKKTVVDWENHLDAVNVVKEDFMAGYCAAKSEDNAKCVACDD